MTSPGRRRSPGSRQGRAAPRPASPGSPHAWPVPSTRTRAPRWTPRPRRVQGPSSPGGGRRLLSSRVWVCSNVVERQGHEPWASSSSDSRDVRAPWAPRGPYSRRGGGAGATRRGGRRRTGEGGPRRDVDLGGCTRLARRVEASTHAASIVMATHVSTSESCASSAAVWSATKASRSTSTTRTRTPSQRRSSARSMKSRSRIKPGMLAIDAGHVAAA